MVHLRGLGISVVVTLLIVVVCLFIADGGSFDGVVYLDSGDVVELDVEGEFIEVNEDVVFWKDEDSFVIGDPILVLDEVELRGLEIIINREDGSQISTDIDEVIDAVVVNKRYRTELDVFCETAFSARY